MPVRDTPEGRGRDDAEGGAYPMPCSSIGYAPPADAAGEIHAGAVELALPESETEREDNAKRNAALVRVIGALLGLGVTESDIGLVFGIVSPDAPLGEALEPKRSARGKSRT